MILRGTDESASTMTEYLHHVSLDTSWLDDECGSVEYAGWYGRIGRWIILEDTVGRHYSERFATVADAVAAFDHIRLNVDYDPFLPTIGRSEPCTD